MQFKVQIWIFISAIFIALVLNPVFRPTTKAQGGDEGWTPPTNLSKSAGTADPVIVVDVDGSVHVIWQDTVAEVTVYTHGSGDQWESPKVIKAPFGTFRPVLINDSANVVHAFWIDTEDENKLYHSSISASNFAKAAWSSARRLADSVIHVAVAVDPNGDLHVSYIRTLDSDDFPAGVYYRKLDNRSKNWTNATPLYKSLYFRVLTAEDANLEIATASEAESQKIYVAWDDPARNRIFLAKSTNGGHTWNEPIEVTGPRNSVNASKPHDVKVAAQGGEVLLIWQEGDIDVSCRQFYQISTDSGDTWGMPESMLDDIQTCPQENQLLVERGGRFVLQSVILDQTYLLAWDGTRWSDAQLQQTLSNFVDPDTNNPIDFECRQWALGEENEIYFVGCDGGPGAVQGSGGVKGAGDAKQGTGGDIWITSRSLDAINDWFPQPSSWRKPSPIISNVADLSSLNLVSDNSGFLHAIWVQRESGALDSNGKDAIFYARWDGQNWSVLSSILDPPFGRVDDLSAAIDSNGRLYVAWSGGQSGEIYFSWANASLASSTLEWATPQALPIARSVGSSPDLLIDETGVLYIVYAIPLNEDRGIYITQSPDGGETWSTPVRIFDGVADKWEMVDQPHLSETPNGDLHIIWTRYSAPKGQGPVGLYYAHSEDGGRTWSNSEEVVTAPVLWSEIRGDSRGIVHRVWQESKNDLPVIWFEFSLDDGKTWSRPTNISGLESNRGSASLIVDRSGRVHLLQISQEITGNLFLREWIWEEDHWTAGESLKIGNGTLKDGKILAADISPDGYLAVLIFKLTKDPSTEDVMGEIVFTGRSLGLPAPAPSELQTSTPNPSPTRDFTSTPEMLPTSTQSINPKTTEVKLNPIDSGLQGSSSNQLGVIAGIASTGVIIVIAILVGLRSKNNLRN